ncbi:MULTISPECIES: hypothetical protein [Burkholderia]|uniref:hypothetical protein n=1 Tax=Burkholderia TaxID=32008 RepID=UPI000B08F278|nr:MULTISPECIES: hypothetical protein [Burkholderia]
MKRLATRRRGGEPHRAIVLRVAAAVVTFVGMRNARAILSSELRSLCVIRLERDGIFSKSSVIESIRQDDDRADRIKLTASAKTKRCRTIPDGGSGTSECAPCRRACERRGGASPGGRLISR